jgi:hypothetical protein
MKVKDDALLTHEVADESLALAVFTMCNINGVKGGSMRRVLEKTIDALWDGIKEEQRTLAEGN